MDALLNSADVAVLLTEQATLYNGFSLCGFADGFEHFKYENVDPIFTAAVFHGECDMGYTFLHELGHLMGAHHENDPEPHAYANAHILDNGEGTIMA